VGDISATNAIRRYAGPILAIHGTEDRVVPFAHLARLVETAHAARADDPGAAPVESLVIPGGQHSWLYEYPAYRGAIGRFLARALGGPFSPDEAGRIAEAVNARRPEEHEHGFSALPQTAREGRAAVGAGGGGA